MAEGLNKEERSKEANNTIRLTASQFTRDMKKILEEKHDISSVYYISLRKNIEVGIISESTIHEIAQLIAVKDKEYNSYLTNAESQLFYAAFEATPDEEEREEQTRTISRKERNTLNNILKTDDPEEFERWVKEMEHWMVDNFPMRLNKLGWIHGEIRRKIGPNG